MANRSSLMLSIQVFKHKNQKVALLVDVHTSMPLLYPLLFADSKLFARALNTQLASLQAVKLFYEYWQSRYNCSFCHSFLRANTNPQIAVQEFDAFASYLQDSRKKMPEHNDSAAMSITLVARLRAILQFVSFLNTEFITNRYLDLSSVEVATIHNYISKRINEKREDLRFFSRKSSRENISHQNYHSLNSEMVKDLFRILRPTTNKQPNPENPFKRLETQFRNYIILRLLINYGLRIGELLLLETSSIKRTSRGTYALVITNTEDEDDRKSLSIKTKDSHRVLDLESTDYKLLTTYITHVRSVNQSGKILFITIAPPYKPLDYQSIKYACVTLTAQFKKIHPEYFDDQFLESIRSLTPHMFRHTWATYTLAAIYKIKRAEIMRATKLAGIVFSEKGVMDEAKDELRKLGGWSVNSQVPNLYAARFIQEKANMTNLMRLKSEPSDNGLTDEMSWITQ